MGSNWKSVNARDLFMERLPNCGACYALYSVFNSSIELFYIGSAENLEKRILNHGIQESDYGYWINTPWGDFPDLIIKYKPSKKFGDWLMVEARLIRKLQPPANRKGVGKRTKSILSVEDYTRKKKRKKARK